jgi:leucyl/phenylalanyl-tRNA--protein transferase
MLLGYQKGVFLMADEKTAAELFWVKPKRRGILPVGKLHISKSLKKFIRTTDLSMSLNTCFSEVVEHCSNRPNTWINEELRKLYLELHKLKHAVSIEIWSHKQLIGGLFGVRIGSCFCGESMFSSSKNGSKLAMIVTMAHLCQNKFTLFDTQFLTEHLSRMGGREISQSEYEKQLYVALGRPCEFLNFPINYSWSEVIQLNNHKL